MKNVGNYDFIFLTKNCIINIYYEIKSFQLFLQSHVTKIIEKKIKK